MVDPSTGQVTMDGDNFYFAFPTEQKPCPLDVSERLKPLVRNPQDTGADSFRG